MFFLIQIENNELSFDNLMLKDLIKSEKYCHNYELINNKDFFKIDENEQKVLKNKKDFPKQYFDAIPLGTIEFTQNYFKIFYSIEKENPIEIPPILRKEEFLKRKYSIVSYDEIPKNGCYFIKDVSQLKVFSYEGELSYFLYDDIFETPKEFDFSLHLE